MVSENIARVKQNIAAAARRRGGPSDDITLVCVTKNVRTEAIREAISAGVNNIGENRVQEALLKYDGVRVIKWHLVGHLQTNKARDAVRIFDLIHSLDSLRLAEAIDKEAKKLDKVQDVLLEVNVSGEKSKFGVSPDEAGKLLADISRLNNVKVRGLMTIAPLVDNPEQSRPYFRILRELRDRINNLRLKTYDLRLLSMGMSQDYEVAIEEGSNMVRIGRAIFEN